MSKLTEEQVKQVMEIIRSTPAPLVPKAVREYIGARYVPLFANPLEWSDTREYEPLTIVTYQGNSYTSMQYVPTGIEITNTSFWALTGNYNAQIEAYRQEVRAFDGRITQNSKDIAALEGNVAADIAAMEGNVEGRLQVFDGRITQNAADIAALEGDLEDYRKLNIGWIGDSYSDASTTPYPMVTTIGQLVKADKMSNQAIAGSGFAGGSAPTKFIGQLDALGAEQPDTNVIVIYGGQNDQNLYISGSAGQSQVQHAMTAFFTRAKELFPNALYIIFGPNFIGAHMTPIVSFTDNMIQNCVDLKLKYKFCEFASTLQYVYDNYQSSDNSHPNAKACRWMAKYFASAINGNEYMPFYVSNITACSGVTIKKTTVISKAGWDFSMGVFTFSLAAQTSANVDICTASLSYPQTPYYLVCDGARKIIGYAQWVGSIGGNAILRAFISGNTIPANTDMTVIPTNARGVI